MLNGSADNEDVAVLVRDRLREQVRDNTAARTNVTLGFLCDQWPSSLLHCTYLSLLHCTYLICARVCHVNVDGNAQGTHRTGPRLRQGSPHRRNSCVHLFSSAASSSGLDTRY
jgi:hypothetical protein